ncbi:MAG TPA: hypothetical protein VKG91_17190 [Roseiarcus sp.]|nr:hypothetical protein [Roseiarcus sp.]
MNATGPACEGVHAPEAPPATFAVTVVFVLVGQEEEFTPPVEPVAPT